MPIEVDFQPVGRHVRVEPGTTILDAAQKAGVGLSAVCGGGGSCGTCLVRLAPDSPVSPPNSVERDELDAIDLAAGLRLACQVELLHSVRVDVPPDSLTAPQRTQVEGEERPVQLAPAVTAYDLLLPPATQTDLRADWERLGDALTTDFPVDDIPPIQPQVAIIEHLPTILRKNEWRVRIGLRDREVVSVNAPDTPVLGLAVDIGTTKVAGYLVDLISGDTLAMQGLMNPQIAYGEDVMARIAYTIENADGLSVLQTAIVNALNQLAQDLCIDANHRLDGAGVHPFHPTQIAEAVVVGNTAMHHLFLGLPVKQLGLAPYVAAVSSPLDVRAREIGLELAAGGMVHLLPNIAGFVGADHVSMLLATGTHEKSGVVVSLDIGTNTEITLAANGRLLSCSTASGPAFEGAHIRDGMRAADGAVERVRVSDGKIEYQTINGQPAVGICGSGILDAIAQLRLADVLNRRGAMVQEHPLVRQTDDGPEVVLVSGPSTHHGRDIVLRRKDVSEIQLAKGAIRAGIEILLGQVNLTYDDVDEFIIAGAFGTYIEVDSAMTIGMFPPLPRNRFRQVGNAAGIGAKLSLLSTAQRNEAAALAARVEYLELTNYPGFVNQFAKAMSL
jgi:uncharacterized 2Fe-2S/4Fe-4S cluster protein (DUF4445 family)